MKRRNPGRSFARFTFGLIVSLLVLAFPLSAMAHSGEESYVYFQVFDDGLEGRVEFPVQDLNEVLGLNIPQDEEAALAATAQNLELIQQYAADHLALGLDDALDWTLVFDGYSVVPAGNGTYSVVNFVVAEDFDQVPREFVTFYNGIIEAKPERAALLLIETDWQSGTFRNEANHLLRYTASNTTQTVSLDETSWFRGFAAVVGLGMEHIQIGTDHILFILALVLPAVLIWVRSRGWAPAPSFGSSLWRVVKIATSFTIAHTITLTLGGLGIVEFSPRLVESVIAISIALAAAHNLRPIAFNREWLIAFVFGLFHGFGFAGLLAELGLDRSNRIVSLLGFNIGIEIGQIAIILLLFPALFIMRRTRYYLGLMRIGSIALIAISLGWLLDRAFDIDIGVDQVLLRFFLWPRPLLIVGIGTLIAVGLYYYERSRDRLIPIEPDGEPPPQEDKELVESERP